jgi:WD40 repeat protein
MTVYKAFISYSHAADGKLAPSLQKALGRFGRAWYQRAAFRIFRDETNLSLNPGLWTSIEKALSESEYFLLLCSPDAAQSKWVSREVDYWIRHSSSQKLLLVLTDGQVIWDPATADFDWSQTTLPQNLSKAYPEEPLYMDLRWARTAENLSLMKPRFRDQIADILATLTDRPKDELIGEDVRVQRKARRLAWFISLLLSALTVIAVTAAIWAFHERELAQEQTKLALARQLAARSELLRIQNPDLLERSTLLSIHAIKRLHSIETDQALRSNLEILPRRLVLLKHTQPVTMLALSHDGKYLAASSVDKVVRVWEFPLGRKVVSLSHLGQVTKIAFSPNGHLLVTGTEDGKAVIWELPDGKHWRSIDLKGRINAVEFSPDGHNVLVAGADIGVRLWSLGSDPSVKVLASSKVIAATFRGDSRFVATAELEDDHIRIWDTVKMSIALELPQTDAPHDLAFSSDGRYLAVASGLANQNKSNAIWLWDVQNVKRVARIQQEGYIRSIHFSPDGSLVAAKADDGFARVWRTSNGEAVAEFTHGPPYAIRSIAWSADGQTLATTSTDRTARVWNLRSGREIARMTHGDTVNTAIFNSDPPYLVTASGGPFPYWLDRSVGIWELPPSTEHVRLAQSAGANSVVFSPDGRMVATSSDDGNVRLFKVPSGELLTTINHVDAVTDIAFGPGGKWLAAASDRRIFPEPQDDLVRVWDVSQHIESLRIPHVDLVRSIAVSPDGQYLATGGGGGVMPKTKDHSVHIWEMPGGRPVATIPATSDVLKVGFSPDGKLGASIERTGILTLWRPESGVEVTRHNLGIQAQGFAFDHSGRRLAVATHDSARVYDIRNLHELQRIPHESFVNAVAFSPDDRYLASGDSGKSARIWDLDENREVARFYHDEIVSSVAFSPDPDGRLLATASFGKTAHLWLWRKEDLVAEACTRLTRDLNKQEWHQYLGSELQYPTCNHIP